MQSKLALLNLPAVHARQSYPYRRLPVLDNHPVYNPSFTLRHISSKPLTAGRFVCSALSFIYYIRHQKKKQAPAASP